MTAAETVRMIRRKLLMEQKEFAENLGITRVCVSNYETGKRLPRFATIKKIIALAKQNNINIPVEDFLEN